MFQTKTIILCLGLTVLIIGFVVSLDPSNFKLGRLDLRPQPQPQKQNTIKIVRSLDVNFDREREKKGFSEIKAGIAAERVKSDKISDKLESEKEPENKSPTARFFIYSCRSTDTLWDIAEQFYGAGKYYPIILQHNPKLSIYNLGQGVILRLSLNLLQNRDGIDKLYQQITITDKGHTYWFYSIRPGDTLDSIVSKFYPEGASAKQITEINPEVEIVPDNTLKIIMD